MFTVARTAACLIAVMVVTGCGSTSSSPPGSKGTASGTSTSSGTSTGIPGSTGRSEEGENNTMKDAFDALMKRPNLTVVEADYQSMYETIRTRLVTEIGTSTWLLGTKPTGVSACGGAYSDLDEAQERLYSAGSSSGNLPDALWDRAVAIVSEVAAQHGFGAPEVIVSGPGDHEVEFKDPYSGYLTFGTGANTILFGGTGCHLTETAHQRGTYLAAQY